MTYFFHQSPHSKHTDFFVVAQTLPSKFLPQDLCTAWNALPPVNSMACSLTSLKVTFSEKSDRFLTHQNVNLPLDSSYPPSLLYFFSLACITKYFIFYFLILFTVCLPPTLEHKLQENKGFVLFCFSVLLTTVIHSSVHRVWQMEGTRTNFAG